MEPIEELKATCLKLGAAFEELKAENNKQIAKGVKEALAEAKLDKIGQTLDDLTGKRDDLEKRIKADAEAHLALERVVNELKVRGVEDPKEAKSLIDWHETVKMRCAARQIMPPATITIEEFRATKAAQQKFLRVGKDGLSPEEHKAMTVGTDTDGGFFVTPDVGGRIVTRVFDLSPIRQIANVQQINSDALEGLEDINEADAGWVGEVGARSDTNTPQVGKYRIEAFEMYASPKASQKLLDDSSIDIEAWLAAKVADKFARTEGSAFVIGDGVAKPRGFTSYVTAATADATRAWGTPEHVATGASADFFTTQGDPLFTLVQAFKTRYLANARWVTNRAVVGKIRKFKTTTTLEYIWQPGLALGQPDKLLGYPLVNAEDMPALAANSLSMAFGDFKEGYQIVDRLGVRTLRDPYTDKPYVKFYTIKRTGGAIVNFEAIKFLKFI